MATQSTNTLSATITATDINGNTSINRGLGSPTLAGVQGVLSISNSVAAGGPTTLATGNFFNIYIKNDSAPGSGITLTPVLTRNDATVVTLTALQPGGVIIIWNVINTVVASGYTTVAVTIAGGTCQLEYFVGS